MIGDVISQAKVLEEMVEKVRQMAAFSKVVDVFAATEKKKGTDPPPQPK